MTAIPEDVERAFAFLTRKYVQRADERQRAMGLQYTEAETHDLAKQVASFALTVSQPAMPDDVERAIIEVLHELERQAVSVAEDVLRLVVAARKISFDGLFDSDEPQQLAALAELDAANEAFADRVAWDKP